MKMNLSGTISTTPHRLVAGSQLCYGVTRANGNRFSIKISEKDNQDAVQFLETLLHEMLHLYFFIIIGMKGKNVAEWRQHNVIDVVVPFMLNKMAMELQPKRRKHTHGENS